jgi:hypothetical protein
VNNRTFLPLFFAALAVLLVGAIGWRINAYRQGDVRSTINGPAALDSAPSGTQAQRNAGNVPQPQIVTEGETGLHADGYTAPVTGTVQTAASQQKLSLREQRFAEALAAAQRATAEQPQKIAVNRPEAAPAIVNPPPKPAEKPGILARIGNAISSAFNGNSSASAAPQPPQQAHNPPQRPDNGREPNEKEKEPKPKDATSDTTPPQLQGLVFNPASITDGQETMLIVTAADDLSGIRNISGSVSSPTGKALQGFAAQREAPESPRYVARIAVPKDAEQGMWKLNFLSITDNAGNTTNINSSYNAGYAFSVTSARPDSTPPTLRSVYVEKRSMNGGDKNTVFVQATDDKSGVAIVSGVFQSPAKTARIGFGCRSTGPETFECDVVPPKSVDCGDWQLEQIQLQDKAQNMATVRGDNAAVAAVKINVLSDKCDSVPPTVDNLVLEPMDVSNANDSVVTVTATVNDDLSGVASVSGQVAGPPADNGQLPRIYFAFQASDVPQTWVGKINIPKFAAKGTWSIVWLQALDKSNNMKTYSQADPVIQGAKITVH